MPDEQPARRITLGKIVAYPFGVLLILAGLGALIDGSILGWILLVGGGLIALPIVRAKLKETQGISLSRWATVGIVLMLMVAGGMAMSGSDTGNEPAAGSNTGGDGPSEPDANGNSENSGPEENLIEGPPESLLPTIDDFDAGWRTGSSDSPREKIFFNSETDSLVIYNVTIHDSISEAQTDLENRRPEDMATDDVSTGEEGFLYKYDARSIIIEFRVQNVVGYVEYNGGPGVLTPESNAASLARTFEDSIRN